MKKADEREVEEIGKEIRLGVKVICVALAIYMIGMIIIINY